MSEPIGLTRYERKVEVRPLVSVENADIHCAQSDVSSEPDVI